MNSPGRIALDKVGAFASAACAVHCLLSGLALGLLSVAGLGFIASKTTDIAFLVVTLSVASIAVFSGVRRHGSWIPARLFLAGVLAIILSHFLLDHESREVGMRWVTTIFAVAGGSLLVAFHVANLRLLRHCSTQ